MIEAIRSELAARADPAKAAGMQAYMKSEMPFYGVQKPAREAIARAVFAAHPLDGFDAWRDTVLRLWREATHREERYLAIRLAPGEVERYCAAHRLSPLSRREALKNVTSKGARAGGP